MLVKTLFCVFLAAFGGFVVFGQDAEGDAPPAYEKRKISLTAKRSVKTRKVRKGVIPPAYGIKSRDDDFSKDDKLDIAVIKVLVANKTGQELGGFRLICEFYGRNAGIKKKIIGPIGAEEAAVAFDSKGKFECEFKKYTLFDRNEDEYEVGKRTSTSDRLPTFQISAHGVMFAGYKVTLLDGDDNVVKEVFWPSNITKIDLDERLLDWDVPKPPRLSNVGGGKLVDFVSPSKNPPGEVAKSEDGGKKKSSSNKKKSGGDSKKRTDDGGGGDKKGKKGWRDAL